MDVLRAFFARERSFFLTGGAALAGFHLKHRTTMDLDLFTLDGSAYARGRKVLEDVADELCAETEITRSAPGFQRFVLRRGDDAVVVDLVRERVPQAIHEKLEREGIVLDPALEILANKLSALVGRAEERDLVDVLMLERAGFHVEDALPHAMAKDGGCTPATLAWLLSEIEIPDDAVLAAEVEPTELRMFIAGLISRLLRAAAPSTTDE